MRTADGSRLAVAIGVVGAVLFVAAALLPHPPAEIRVAPFDRFAEAIRDGQVPFRDFTVEYPPGSMPAVVAPLALPFSYDDSFRVVQALCGALLVVAVAVLLRGSSTLRVVVAVSLVALLPLLLGPVVVARYDLWPAALLAWGLVALEASRVRLSGALVGAAIAAKLYPLSVLPALAAYTRERSDVSPRRLFVPLAAVLAALSVGFVLVAPGGVAFGLSRQLGRGLQIESVGSSVVLVGKWIGVATPGVEFAAGSQTLTGAAADSVSFVMSVLGLALLVALGIGVWRLRERVIDLRLSCAALVALVLVTSKVLSPQFLVWLIPLALVVETRAWAWIVGLLALACVLTRMIYPTRYEELVALDAQPVALLVARNALLVAVAWLLVAHLARRLLRSGAGALEPPASVSALGA